MDNKLNRRSFVRAAVVACLVIAALASTAAFRLAQAADGVWAQYDFESNANDSSGGGRNATLVNGPTFVAGHAGQAVNLSGSSQYVALPAGVVSGLNDFTIAAWVRLDTTGSWRRIFDFGTGTSANMFLVPTSGSTIRFAITTSGSGSEQRINGTAALPTGVWKHVAVTLSGNTGTLYVDGVQVGQNTAMTLRPSSLGSTTNNWLGRSQYSGDAYLDGQIDQFIIYNRGLSAAEVQALATGGPTPTTPPPTTPPPTTPPPTTPPPTNPAAWYKFDESGGTTAVDASGNGKNATVMGGMWVAGKVGNAVNLSGSSQYVSLPAGIMSGLNDFTIATWVKLDTTGSWRRLFDFGSSTSVNMFLAPTSGSTIRFAITTGGSGGEQRIDGGSALPTGVWKHVAVTLSGSTGRLYVDGVQVGQNTAMTLRPSSLGSTGNNWLGRSQYAGDAYLDGQIDDFRIYGRALSASDVYALFNPGGTVTPTLTPSQTPTGGTWPLKTYRVFWVRPTDVAYDQRIVDGINGVMLEAQRFYQQELGVTFRFNPVEVLNGAHTASWYSTTPNGSDPYWYTASNLRDEIKRQTDIVENDSRWKVVGYISAEGNGGASHQWVFLPKHDTDGAAGYRSEPMSRWYGGMVHELGHAFTLPDSTYTDGTPMSASFYDYPNCHFTASQKNQLLTISQNSGYWY